MSDLSVYMFVVPDSMMPPYRSFALLLTAAIWIVILSVHHGGRIYGSIVSIFSIVIGNCCKIFLKLDRCLISAVLTQESEIMIGRHYQIDDKSSRAELKQHPLPISEHFRTPSTPRSPNLARRPWRGGRQWNREMHTGLCRMICPAMFE